MTRHAKAKPWRVVRQHHDHAETDVCAHRWEWVAELCAIRRESARRHASQIGIHYVARSAPRTDRHGLPQLSGEPLVAYREHPDRTDWETCVGSPAVLSQRRAVLQQAGFTVVGGDQR